MRLIRLKGSSRLLCKDVGEMIRGAPPIHCQFGSLKTAGKQLFAKMTNAILAVQIGIESKNFSPQKLAPTPKLTRKIGTHVASRAW
jgi:hypothetical protein